MDIMQCCGGRAGCTDTAVGLLSAAVGDAGSDEGAHEFFLVCGLVDGAHHVAVGGGGDGVCVADQGDFEGVLGHPAEIYGLLEDGGRVGLER